METYVIFIIFGTLAFLLSVLSQKGWFPFHRCGEPIISLIHDASFVVFLAMFINAIIIMVAGWVTT